LRFGFNMIIRRHPHLEPRGDFQEDPPCCPHFGGH
jgi:hypothetical protein